MQLKDAEGMEREAARCALSLMPRKDGATIVALSGELGAGKTAFVQGVARALGIQERVTSPTFVIMKAYDIESGAFRRLIHIDAYRLKGLHHLTLLGWKQLLENPLNLICMEWPEMCEGALPQSAIRITLRYSGEHEREIIYPKDTRTEAAGTP